MNLRALPLLAIASLFIGCGGTSEPEPPAPAPEVPAEPTPDPMTHASLFEALPPVAADYGKAVIDLGRMLYFEPRLSKNHDISCASCHPLDRFGADGQPTSPGHKGLRGGRNSPTTLNASLHIAQFWDGRAPTLEDQAKGPVLNPIEMAMPDEKSVVAVLESIPGYVEAFAAAFPNNDPPLSYDNMARAIGAFERGLLTPSKFDHWLRGKSDALSAAERTGLDVFVTTGCTACHAGVGIGGGAYQKLGLVRPYPTEDVGRSAVTKNEAEKFFFKVPSLRNVTKTGPWLHDGSVATIEEMVTVMARHQLGKELSDDDVGAIVTFLGSLTGELDPDYTRKPELPESGPKTPKPDPS